MGGAGDPDGNEFCVVAPARPGSGFLADHDLTPELVGRRSFPTGPDET